MVGLVSYEIALGARGSIWSSALKSNTVMWCFPGRISIGTFPSEDMFWPHIYYISYIWCICSVTSDLWKILKGIFSGTIWEPKYQGSSISTSFVESEKPLLNNFGSIPASVRWIELFEKLSEELGCPVSGPDRSWTLENTQKCWSNIRNILQERKADLSLDISDTELSEFLNVDQGQGFANRNRPV